MQLLPSSRVLVVLLVVASLSSAVAVCQPPDASLDWRFVGEVVQNVRTVSDRTFNLSGWRTIRTVSNSGSTSMNASLSSTYDTNVTVSAAIARWGLGQSYRNTFTDTFEVTVPARSRVRLEHQRREHMRDLSWDVMCAWRHNRTGEARLTTYGRGYRGTTWRLYDAYQLQTERL